MTFVSPLGTLVPTNTPFSLPARICCRPATTAGLMVDFAMRFLGGSNISPIGSLSTLCVTLMEVLLHSKPKWISGPAKQFASLCGLMFATLASFFFLMEVRGGGAGSWACRCASCGPGKVFRPCMRGNGVPPPPFPTPPPPCLLARHHPESSLSFSTPPLPLLSLLSSTMHRCTRTSCRSWACPSPAGWAWPPCWRVPLASAWAAGASPSTHMHTQQPRGSLRRRGPVAGWLASHLCKHVPDCHGVSCLGRSPAAGPWERPRLLWAFHWCQCWLGLGLRG